jgi:hypothetical protein
VEFTEDKLEWICLGKGKDEEKYEIELPGGAVHEDKEVLRWLEIWLDQKLDFKEHVMRKVNAGKNVLGEIGRLERSIKGIGVGNMRKMYIACVKGTMDYGSKIWWKEQEGMARKIDKVDEQGMRRIGGHFRTAPGKAIAMENDMIPMRH